MARVTLKDIAQRAGVSLTTASFALNNVPGRVSEKVREQVLRQAKELNYTPNASARNLRLQENNTIMLVYSEEFLGEQNASTMQMVAGTVRFASEHGKDVLISMMSDNHENYREEMQRYQQIWNSRRVEGMIFHNNWDGENSKEFYRGLYQSGVNLVNISPFGREEDYSNVYIDYRRIMEDAMDFVAQEGYRAVYHLTREVPVMTTREEGYRSAIQRLGLEGHPLYYRGLTRTKKELWDLISPVVREAGERGERIAISCWNDVDAVNVLELLNEMGYRVPDAVGVIGFDDIPVAEHCVPKLTTILQPFGEMACRAVQLLLDGWEQRKNRMVPEPVSIELPCSIIKRQSI